MYNSTNNMYKHSLINNKNIELKQKEIKQIVREKQNYNKLLIIASYY